MCCPAQRAGTSAALGIFLSHPSTQGPPTFSLLPCRPQFRATPQDCAVARASACQHPAMGCRPLPACLHAPSTVQLPAKVIQAPLPPLQGTPHHLCWHCRAGRCLDKLNGHEVCCMHWGCTHPCWEGAGGVVLLLLRWRACCGAPATNSPILGFQQPLRVLAGVFQTFKGLQPGLCALQVAAAGSSWGKCGHWMVPVPAEQSTVLCSSRKYAWRTARCCKTHTHT